MYGKRTTERYSELLPGIKIKTLVYGQNTLMTQFNLKKGSELPRHAHPYEQIGFLVKGRLILSIGDSKREVGVGDSWCIEPNVEHSAEVPEDAVAVEVFAPARQDYLKHFSEEDAVRT